MPTYVLPQVLVFQDFETTPAALANPLRAHISGGHAYLVRHGVDDEKEDGRLGYYDDLLDTDYDWPNRPAGGVVDEDYVKLYMEDALLPYFEDLIGADSTIVKVSGYNNRVRSATVNFQENGIYGRHADLLDRDVAVGDTVKLRVQPAASDPETLWSYVKDVVGDVVAAVIAAATKDAANPATQSLSTSVTQTAGAENCVSLAADGSSYDGLADGDVSETYTVLVEEGSIDGDYTLARLRVISASGNDDVASVTPAASGSPTEIGTRGLEVTFSDVDTAACSTSADNDEVSYNDLIAGQTWDVVVNQAFTSPDPTSAGSYDNDDDTTYIVEVTKGGVWADSPEISVSTTNGVDLSGPTAVTGAATAVAVGTYGVTVAFSGDGLNKGDRYYVGVTGEAEGPMRTIVLGHNIPEDVPDDSEVDLTLYIRKPVLEITKNREGFAPLVNWETSDTQITVKSGIVAYDDSWTDGGVLQPLDVESESGQGYGLLYVEYRAWLADLCFDVGTIDDVGEINDHISGALHPDNPLKWGVFKALENSNGTEVKYTSVCDPNDTEKWADVLELLLGRDDVYGLVPLTRNRTVLDLYAAHVDSMSSAEEGLWRVGWFNLAGVPTIPVVSAGSDVANHTAATTTDGEIALGVIEDDPLTSGTQYTIVRVPAGNAGFETNEVRAGDVVRAVYVGDGFGNETYSEFVVDEVQSEDQLRLLSGPSVGHSVPAKIEVWRNLTATEESEEIATEAGSWANRRIRAVWPDTVESSGTVQNGYHLCAALSGLASGILPHQGMTRLEVAGFSDVGRTTDKFTRAQLNTMAVAGTWIVTQELSPTSGSLGKVFNRHAVTTADYDNLNEREEMVTRNVDSISYRIKDHFEPFIGISNVTPSMQSTLRAEVDLIVETLKTERFTRQLGGQLISAEVLKLAPHATLKDRFVLDLDVEVPQALNNFAVNIVV